MFPTPLELLFYGVESFSFHINSRLNENIEPVTDAVNINVTTKHMVAADNDRINKVELDINVSSKGRKHPPYKIKLSMIGIFEVTEECPEQHAVRLAQINGASILYGAAREYIFASTAHGKYGSYTLPSISFRPQQKDSLPGNGAPQGVSK